MIQYLNGNEADGNPFAVQDHFQCRDPYLGFLAHTKTCLSSDNNKIATISHNILSHATLPVTSVYRHQKWNPRATTDILHRLPQKTVNDVVSSEQDRTRTPPQAMKVQVGSLA